MKDLVELWIIFGIKYSRLFWYIIRKHEKVTHNPPIRIYVNRIEHMVTFKTKTGYYLQLLTPEMFHSKINKVKLVHCNILKFGLLIKILNYTVQHRNQLLYKILDFCVLLKTCVETLVMI